MMTGQGSGNGKSFIWKRKACEFSFELGARRSLILTSHLSSKDLKATGKLIFEFRHECIKTTRIQMLSFLPFQRDGSVSMGN